jgi:hypothetical protein
VAYLKVKFLFEQWRIWGEGASRQIQNGGKTGILNNKIVMFGP